MADSSSVKVTSETLTGWKNLFAQKVETLNSYLSRVDDEVVTLRSVAAGDSLNPFYQAMEKWQEAYRKVVDALNNMESSMGSTINMYNNNESDVSHIGSSLTSSLPGF